MKKKHWFAGIFSLVLTVLSLQTLPAQSGKNFLLPLWPAGHPVLTHPGMTEKVLDRSQDPRIKNRAISQVTEPAIEVFLPDSSVGIALLICPGGAYAYQAYDKEGTYIARWLNERGITACILKYRLPAEVAAERNEVDAGPAEADAEPVEAPLQDAQRAMRIIRSRAAAWQIDPEKIGVMGFSAGGHLASTLGTAYHREVYEKLDSVDQLSARPDLMVLVYPVISMQEGVTHAGSRENLLGPDPSKELMDRYSSELQVTVDTPPTFLIHASDDGAVSPENSLLFYRALLDHGVPAEMHLFVEGGHGFGINKNKVAGREWPGLFEAWVTSPMLNRGAAY